jgi:hypothetical protein
MQKDVRGQRVYGILGATKDHEIFNLDMDDDHEGLRLTQNVSEENEALLPIGRTIVWLIHSKKYY